EIPYSLRLEAFTIDGFPGLHSAVMAGSPEMLVVFGGRLNGMHGFPGNRSTTSSPSFPSDSRNTTIYVLDLVKRKLLGQAKVDALPMPIANQFTASNAEYYLQGPWLYVVGGYGLAGAVDPKNPSLTPVRTLPSVIAIDFVTLSNAVITHKPL